MNEKYNRLTLTGNTTKNKLRRTMVEAICDCGVKKYYRMYDIVRGKSKSCGCFAKEMSRESTKQFITHGQSGSRLYQTWKDMKKRCYNPSSNRYYRYGERGIVVCDDWKNCFESFMNWANSNGYSDTLTIDRRNNDGNYEPSNCRFITKTENNKNK